MSLTASAPVRARGLVKRYGEIVAVDGIDISVDAGDIYGFLGPNGAGKTTAMRMLLGLVSADEGSVELFGLDPHRELPEALDGVAGFVETPRFYGYLSGRTNLELLAGFDGGGAAGRVDAVLDVVDLLSRAGDRVGTYSQGMKQRLGLAASLLRDPKLLILDEPTNGLDPAGIRDMRTTIKSLSERGMTIFLSSHLLVEVEELCTRVAIIRSGRVVYEGSLDEMRATVVPRVRLRTSDQSRAVEIANSLQGISKVEWEGEEIRFTADEAARFELSRALVSAGVGIAALVPEGATLEGLFFDLTEGEEAGAS
jgi:ABC-2 type transport system ATP-binding protein